jgi:hypothetical protein
VETLTFKEGGFTMQLLNEGKLLLRKNEWVKQANPSFNVIEVLRNIYDEVNLHSRFICSLIDKPNDIAIKLLDELILIMNVKEFDASECQVLREFRNIDILIKNNSKAIIIENKIYAEDQPKQLERYYEVLIEEGYSDSQIEIFYLTLDAKEPSNQSLGKLDLDRINLISYEKHIDSWIQKCIEYTAVFPSYRESLVQYLSVVKNLTGKSEDDLMKEITDEIASSIENMKSAKLISEGFELVKPKVQLKFWQRLEEKLCAKGYKFEDELRYSKNKVEDYYQKTKRNKYYGLLSKIHDIDEEHSLYLYIEIDHNIYWGYTVANKGFERNINKNECFEYLFKKFDNVIEKNCQDYNIFGTNDHFIAWLQFVDQRLDFKQFSDNNILEMIREEYLEKFIIDFSTMIDDTTQIYCNELNKS